MLMARWKDLCIDVVDPQLMGPFWAELLGLELHVRDDQMRYLTGPTPEHTIWLNPVAEPVSAKQRLHLDVHCASLDEVLALGATPLDVDSFSWKVVRDPEGGELCVFERGADDERVAGYRVYELVLDALNPRELTTWWAEVFGVPAQHHDEHDADWLEGIPRLPFESIVTEPVPEAKQVKNRIHWDVLTDDVALLVEHGATVVRERGGDIDWTVLADPEGNEFCAFVR